MARFQTHRNIEFADTDLVGICHFARFFVFMESAEHEFLHSLGSDVWIEEESRTIGWPRVSASCDYKSPARFRDRLDISVEIAQRGRSSITYRFTMKVAERVVATGELTSVCCEMTADGPRPMAIPDDLVAKLEG